MRHPFEVSIVANNGADEIIVARRSTLDKANVQAVALRAAIGTFNRDGIPAVTVRDLRNAATPDYGDND